MSEIPDVPLQRNNYPHGISALIGKKSEMLGEIEKLKEEIAGIEQDMKVLDRAILILEPGTSEEVLQPRAKRKVQRHFKPGELKRAILSELKRSGTPLTVRELAESIRKKKKIEKRITDNVKSTVSLLRKDKIIVQETRTDTYEQAFLLA